MDRIEQQHAIRFRQHLHLIAGHVVGAVAVVEVKLPRDFRRQALVQALRALQLRSAPADVHAAEAGVGCGYPAFIESG